MFIETLRNIVITLVTMLIFISAVELILPNNKMKKYISFVLGLILITVILNPILQLISNGDKNVLDSIKNYEEVFSKNEDKISVNSENDRKSTLSTDDSRKKVFINNFNKNCDNLLKNKFKDMTFNSEVDCDVDFANITLNVKKLKIGVTDNKIKVVKKVVINEKNTDNKNEDNKEFTEIRDYASNELNIPKEKIEVYKG